KVPARRAFLANPAWARRQNRATARVAPTRSEMSEDIANDQSLDGLSKGRDGVHRRAGSAANRERSCCQQEIPALPVRRRVRQRLEITVVEEVHAQIQQREIMHSSAEPRRRDVLRMIAAENRNVALLEPGDNRRIKPRGPAPFGSATKP